MSVFSLKYFYSRNLESQYKIIFSIISILPIIALLIFFYFSFQSRITDQLKKHITSLAHSKQQVMNYNLIEIGKSLESIAVNKRLIKLLEQYSRSSQKKDNVLLSNENYADAFSTIRNYQESFWGKLHHVFIVNTEGAVILSPPHGKSKGSHLGNQLEINEFFRQGLQNPTITDFFGFKEKTHFHQLYLHPIKGITGKTLGIIVAEVVIAYQNKILHENLEFDEESKIFLATLNSERIVNNVEDFQKLKPRISFKKVKRSGEAFATETDDNGESVLGYYIHDEKYPWILAIEIRKSLVQTLLFQDFAPIFFLFIFLILGIFIVSRKLAAQFSEPVQEIRFGLDELSNNNFTHNLPQEYLSRSDEIGWISKSYQKAQESLSSFLQEIRNLTLILSDSLNEQKQLSLTIQKGSQQQSQKSKEVIDESQRTSVLVDENAEETDHLMAAVQSAKEVIEQSNQRMIRTVESIESVFGKIDSISGLSTKTEMLALNTSIEASRAGAVGKKFDVIAQNIGLLSNESKKFLDDISKHVRYGMDSVNDSKKNLEQIVQKIELILKYSENLNQRFEEQKQSISKENSLIEESSKISDKNFDESEKNKNISEKILQKSSDLRKLLERFKF